METLKELDRAAADAKWAACYSLRSAMDGVNLNMASVAKAMFHAGEAWAYYQARNVVHTLEDRLSAKKVR